MAKTFNYWRELHKARLEAEWTFRTRQIELLKEQIQLDEDPRWGDELVGAIGCAERIGRKLDEMADEDSMELDQMEDEEEQTVFNPEIEYDFEQLGELVYDCITKQYTNEKGQVFKERADGCFELVKSRRVCLGGLNLAELFAHPVEDNNND